jgi:hypothetical protein
MHRALLAVMLLGAVVLGTASPVWAATPGRTHGTTGTGTTTSIRSVNPKVASFHPRVAAVHPKVGLKVARARLKLASSHPKVASAHHKLASLDPSGASADPQVASIDSSTASADPQVASTDSSGASADPQVASTDSSGASADPQVASIDSSTASAGTSLVGTFKIQAGSCTGGGESGSYFRMVEAGQAPNGSDADYLVNSNSTCSDQTYTLFEPGTSGGLVTGGYQPGSQPAFDGNGNALSNQIVQPVAFFGVNFSVTTAATDPQTNQSVPAPSVEADGTSLTGDLEAWSAGWNKQYFNQGAPKPGGSSPGFTAGPTGTYDSSTNAFTLTWTSQIVGGPFNNFTGQWHLVGTFEPGSGTSPPPTTTPTTTTTGSTSPPTSGTTGTGSSGGTEASSTGTSSGSATGSTGSSTPGATSTGASGASKAATGTLAFTGLPIPLWLPLPLLGVGAALMMPTRRSPRSRRQEL